MSDALKPCPFCGSPALFRSSSDGELVNVRCENWGPGSCLGAGANHHTYEAAAAAWNRRIPSIAEKPQLSAEDLRIIRQWYNCVSDLNPKYLNADGFDDAAVFRKVSALIDAGLPRPQPPEKTDDYFEPV